MHHGEWLFSHSRLRVCLRLLVIIAVLLATLQVAPQSNGHWLALGVCWAVLIVNSFVGKHHRVEGLSVHEGQWFLSSAEQRLPARLLCYHTFGSCFVVLTFEVGASAVWRVNVFSDMMAPADFRRLNLAVRVLREPIG